MILLLRLIRLARALPHLVVGIVLAATRLPRTPPPRGEAQWRLIRWWERRLLEKLGIGVTVHGQAVDGPVLFVANHISWLDIPALLTTIDAGFIGKHELRRWPVLGLLIRRAGTIFIERGGRGAAAAAAEEMGLRLQRGERAAVFPEGTTTTGISVRRFHPRLFDAALRTGAPVQPIALRYDRETIAFVEGESFLRNLWCLLGERGVRIEVELLHVIQPAGHDRRQLAERAHQAIAARITAGRAAAESRGSAAAPEQG